MTDGLIFLRICSPLVRVKNGIVFPFDASLIYVLVRLLCRCVVEEGGVLVHVLSLQVILAPCRGSSGSRLNSDTPGKSIVRHNFANF